MTCAIEAPGIPDDGVTAVESDAEFQGFADTADDAAAAADDTATAAGRVAAPESLAAPVRLPARSDRRPAEVLQAVPAYY